MPSKVEAQSEFHGLYTVRSKVGADVEMRLFAGLFLMLVGLYGCTTPPTDPESPYFARLLIVASDNFDFHDLSLPRLPSMEARVIRDLVNDGFEVQTGTGQMSKELGAITCEGHQAVKINVDGRLEYHVQLLWGGVFTRPMFTAYRIDVYRSQDCSVLRVIGKKASAKHVRG